MQNTDVREAGLKDIPSIRQIYADHVMHGVATFEETPPSVEEMRARYDAIIAKRLPYLVAEREGEVVGYSYATLYRPRSAYRFTVEDSIYIRDGLTGKGIGSALLGTLIARCEAGGWRQMLAVIGNSGNAGSIALHGRLGFKPVGIFRSVGFKHGRWVDTVLMQRQLGEGDATLPA